MQQLHHTELLCTQMQHATINVQSKLRISPSRDFSGLRFFHLDFILTPIAYSATAIAIETLDIHSASAIARDTQQQQQR